MLLNGSYTQKTRGSEGKIDPISDVTRRAGFSTQLKP